MLSFYTNFFNNDLYNELLEFSLNTKYETISDGIYNFQYSEFDEKLRNKIIQTFYNYGLVYDCDVLRLQKIPENFLVTEKYHYHSKININNIVCFLNNDFDGGEFEYLDYNKSKNSILPIPNTAITFPHNLAHKVLPVKNGNRYTVVAFFNRKNKSNKTVI